MGPAHPRSNFLLSCVWCSYVRKTRSEVFIAIDVFLCVYRSSWTRSPTFIKPRMNLATMLFKVIWLTLILYRHEYHGSGADIWVGYIRDEHLHLFERSWNMLLPLIFLGTKYLAAEDRVRARVSPHGICGGQSVTKTGFSASSSKFPCHYHSPRYPY
jgi:hypothetical protein